MFESILCQITEYDPAILESLIELAVENAREGREGRRVGTLFTLGDEQAVLSWMLLSAFLCLLRKQGSTPFRPPLELLFLALSCYQYSALFLHASR